MLIPNAHDYSYGAYLRALSVHIADLAKSGARLFQTEGDDLWETYISSFTTMEEYQYHACRCCRQFIERFGGLVTIDPGGRTTSALWQESTSVPLDQKYAIGRLRRAVEKQKIVGPFFSSQLYWGQEQETKGWIHLHISAPFSYIYTGTLLRAEQKMAEYRQDFLQVQQALKDYAKNMLAIALNLLESDALYRSEKVLGPVKWLSEIHQARETVKGKIAKDNVTWLYVSTAPVGFSHIRSGMAGTLLEDINEGLPLEDVRKRFAAKMHPLQYQRPQAPPKGGQIAEAERIFDKLGLGPALKRRFARIDDIPEQAKLWKPIEIVEKSESLFGHLKPRRLDDPKYEIPLQRMTWIKFQEMVLPKALSIEVLVSTHDSFTSLVTAVDAAAPPILQWDYEEARNPVSWYFWFGGTSCKSFNLTPGWAKVNLLAKGPSIWNGAYMGKPSVFVLIDGARETVNPGACLFPETIRSELHPVRAVIEAYSKRAQLEGMQEASAAGLMPSASDDIWTLRFNVTSSIGKAQYHIDRWD